ncbi:MAG: adenine phosphoribosyltransferase [Deltaproteobacteria bacterium]|jgi:adenine phosphoribosyltransferase|nr:adenine phosphoribosyltransferase [Deltaproteobacteria bacterium]
MQDRLKKHIRDIPDFPKPGIVFKDITPLLQNHAAFEETIRSLVERYVDQEIDTVVGIESRGFLFGTPLAHQLGAGFVPVRKKGKLPYKTIDISYDLEYGSATIEMHTDAIEKGEKVLIIDDLLATGGTAGAACELIKRQGGDVVECAFIVELAFLNGREKIGDVPIHSLVSYS